MFIYDMTKEWPFIDIGLHRMPPQQGVEAYKMFAEVTHFVLCIFPHAVLSLLLMTRLFRSLATAIGLQRVN
jgi:hypothetical protein